MFIEPESVNSVRAALDTIALPSRLRRRHRRLSPTESSRFTEEVRTFLVEHRGVSLDSVERAVTDTVSERVAAHRRKTVPWIDSFCDLDGLRILEVGSGHGASTLAIAEQGARVTATDIDANALALGERRLTAVGLSAEFLTLDAADIGEQFDPSTFDAVLFYASLEHMTTEERLRAIAGAFQVVRAGGFVIVAETPNRLWPYDSHTSRLPFFLWLPDDIAYEYARFSPRAGFSDLYGGSAEPKPMKHFLRRGRGVSFHDFELALNQRARDFEVVSAMQLWRRRRNAARQLAWSASSHGRFERALRARAPDVHPGFFQPFLYLALQRS